MLLKSVSKEFFFLSFLLATPLCAHNITGKAIHISDGDTITILTPSQDKYKIRLSGIDAPTVKLSKSGVCHAKGSKYYNKVKRYTRFGTVEECLKVGRLPR